MGRDVSKFIELIKRGWDFKKLAKDVALVILLEITMGMLNVAFAEKFAPEITEC